jgi:hypothetical protein
MKTAIKGYAFTKDQNEVRSQRVARLNEIRHMISGLSFSDSLSVRYSGKVQTGTLISDEVKALSPLDLFMLVTGRPGAVGGAITLKSFEFVCEEFSCD